MKSGLQILNARFTSKKSFSFLFSFLLISSSFAGIIVTPAESTINISADKAANAINPEFTAMGDITLAESKSNDFLNTAGMIKTLILTAPQGWIFNTTAGTISSNNCKDFKAVSMKVKENLITISYVVKSVSNIDVLTISGIEIKATNGAMIPCLGQIYISAANPGTAKLSGLKMTANKNGQGATNFGIMSQATGNATALAFTSKPDSSIAGIAFNTQPVIITLDQFGNATSNGLADIQNVKLVLSSGTGNLSGTIVLNIGTTGGNGVVSFSDLKITAAGVKKIMAKSGSLTFAVSNEFVVTAANENTASENSTDSYDPDLVCYSEKINAGFENPAI